MRYEKIITAEFLSRSNRFVAQVLIGGKVTQVHVKNTGRCRELLIPGAEVYLEDFTYRPGKRKLMYDLVAVRKGDILINMDSQAPNKAVGEALESGKIRLPGMEELTLIKPETFYYDSRFDFYVEDKNGEKGYVEVKGVTLEKEGIALFPDAPTERGVRHLHGLENAAKNGYHTYALFVIQMEGMRCFIPNDQCHKAFGDALREVSERGVTVLAYECAVTPETMNITGSVPVCLNGNEVYERKMKNVRE